MALGALAVGFSLAHRAAAQERPVIASAQERPVRVWLVGDVALDPIFAKRVASWFDAATFRVHIEAAPSLEAERVLSPEPGTGARVWVTLKTGAEARLYFVRDRREGEPTAYLVRDIRLEHGLDEIGAERVAQAIHFSVVALLEGSASSEREAVVHALESDAPKREERPASVARDAKREQEITLPARRSAVVGVGYAAGLRGDEGIAHGPSASLAVPVGSVLGLAASVRTAVPVTRAFESVDVEIYGATLTLDLAVRALQSSATSIDVTTGPAAELVRYVPSRSTASTLAVADAATEVRPAWELGVRVAFEAPMRWTLVAQCSLHLSRTHYDVATAGGTRDIARPWIVSPGAGVEVRF